MKIRIGKFGSALALVCLTSVMLAGCGWLFNKQEKPLRVEVAFAAGDSLNFDGKSIQSVQLKAYVLKDMQRFNAADVRAFFDAEFDPGFLSQFAKDTLGSVTVIVAPGEAATGIIEVPHAFAKREPSLYIGVIANFNRPPSDRAQQRFAYKIQKASKQTIKVSVNKNVLSRAKKK